MLLEGLEHTPADGPSLRHYLQGRKRILTNLLGTARPTIPMTT